jgi:hypothetical protein
MPANKSYMYGQEVNFGILTNKPKREPYWDYMARRGAGGGTMLTTETTTITDEVYPAREDVPADLWGKPVIKGKVKGSVAALSKASAAVNKNEALAKSAIQSNHSSMSDAVNHPPHYNKGIETTQYIKSWEMNWNQANVIKYVSRYNLKNKNDVNIQIQDLMKAKWYLEDLIRELEKYNPY